MAGPDHVKTAIQHAQRSFFSEKPISNSFEMEALLFAAGSRQCSAATLFGIHAGENVLFVCMCPPKDKVWVELSHHMHFVADIGNTWTPEKATRLMKLFDISQNEVDLVGTDRLKELVLERIALLEVYR
jgi:KEOPS complex subunit Cgi121